MRSELPKRVARSQVDSPVGARWFRLVTVVFDSELQTGVAFCVIGILLTLIVALLFPDFGELIAEMNSVP